MEFSSPPRIVKGMTREPALARRLAMKRTIAATMLAALAVGGLLTVVRAQQKDEPVEPRILAYDKGPAKIDVSKYPADMKANYKVFAEKCSKCHTIARAINCEFALEDEWERYVKRMMNKGGTMFTANDGKQIYDFLVFDSKLRKKALYDKKTKEGVK
jgi:cytochrome c5